MRPGSRIIPEAFRPRGAGGRWGDGATGAVKGSCGAVEGSYGAVKDSCGAVKGFQVVESEDLVVH